MGSSPTYRLSSVDHSLRLIQLLHGGDCLRVSDAADFLGVARSTAHRLLTMLVYRDFAQQDASRLYRAGPALANPASQAPDPYRDLRVRSVEHLQNLQRRTGETALLEVLRGHNMHIILTVESTQTLRVGDRTGVILPRTYRLGRTCSPCQL